MLVAEPAVAAPAWLAPANLSEAVQNKDNPHVAIDSQGDAVAVWELSNGINQVVQAAVRQAGGGLDEASRDSKPVLCRPGPSKGGGLATVTSSETAAYGRRLRLEPLSIKASTQWYLVPCSISTPTK